MNTILSLFLAMTLQLTHAQEHGHADHSHPAETLSSQTAKFVPTDDLKVRMDKILQFSKELKGKKVDAILAGEVGKKIQDTVNDIFKTCKLDPKADAAIHPILGKILAGSRELKSGKYEDGRKKIHESLLDYGKRFTHDGWAP